VYFNPDDSFGRVYLNPVYLKPTVGDSPSSSSSWLNPTGGTAVSLNPSGSFSHVYVKPTDDGDSSSSSSSWPATTDDAVVSLKHADGFSHVYLKPTGGPSSSSWIEPIFGADVSLKPAVDGDGAADLYLKPNVASADELPIWVMKNAGHAPPPELKLASNNSWVTREAFICPRGALPTASLALDLSRADSAPEGINTCHLQVSTAGQPWMNNVTLRSPV
jgi:hypothetical protein